MYRLFVMIISRNTLLRSGIPAGLFLLIPLLLFAQNPYPPTLIPDRINLTVTEDPSTSMAVTWRTDTSVKIAAAEIIPSDGNPLSVRNANHIKATTESLISEDGHYKKLIWEGVAANYHAVVFKHLKPNTLY